MSFAFRQDESVPKSVRRVVRKQLENALEALDESHRESLDERIHSVRKSLKRVRAVVRLVRFSIGDSEYRHENESLRDAARPLSELRDAKVLLEALEKLKKSSRRSDKEAVFQPARKKLRERQRDLHERILGQQGTFSDTAAALEKATKRVEDWGDFSNDWKDIERGIKRVYRSGRRAFDNVKADPSVENLHEWRKQTKYLRHQLELLAPGWPEVIGELAAQAEELGEILGEDHDLAVLHSVLIGDSNGNKSSSSQKILSESIQHRRVMLQGDAIPKGELLYRERPGEFVKRLKAYWKGSESWPKRHRKEKELAGSST